MVASGFFRLFGSSLITLRLLVAIEGILTIFILYLIARVIGGPRLGLLAACFLTIYPWGIVYHRIGFSYNQLSLLLLISFACAWKYSYAPKSSWGWLSAISAGLAFTTDYLGIVAVAFVFVVFWIYYRQRFLWGCFLMTLTVILVNVPLIILDGVNFWEDLSFTLSRTDVPLSQQLINSLFNYYELARQESWFVVGILGLGLLENKRARAMTLFICGLTLVLVVRNLPPVGRNYHHLIQLFPYLALGVAALMLRLLPEVVSIIRLALDILTAPLLKVIPSNFPSTPLKLIRSTSVAAIVVFFVLLTFMKIG